jgi:WD40 repeat protein
LPFRVDVRSISDDKAATEEEQMTSINITMNTESTRKSEKALFSPDGRFLTVPGASHTVVVLDALTNEPWVTYYGHQAGLYRRVSGTITALAWLPNGSSIVSGSTDGSIHIWHARTGIHQRTLTQPQEDCEVLALSMLDDGLLTALRGKDTNTWQLS